MGRKAGKRHVDVQTIFAGKEPEGSTVNAKHEDYTISFIKAMNWYSAHKDPSHAQKYLIEAAKAAKKPQPFLSALNGLAKDEIPTTVAWCIRLLMRGAVMSKKDIQSIQMRVNDLFTKVERDAKELIARAATKPKNTKSVQDYMKDKIRDHLGELEGRFDDFVQTYEVEDKVTYNWWRGQETPGAYMKDVIEWADAKIAEYGKALMSKDEQIIEGYSNYTKRQLGLIVKYFAAIKQQATEYALFKKVNRAPRKRKEKPAAVQVAKMKFKREGSIEAPEIIGAEQLWTYNTKTRVMAKYNASGASGLAVKGTTIVNYDTDTSIQKKLRKPDDTLKSLREAGKVELRKFIDKIRAKGKVPNGRINVDTILVRVVK